MSKSKKSYLPLLITLLVVAAAITWLAIQFFTRTGLFQEPGKLQFADSASEPALQELVTSTVGETKLKADLTVSVRRSSAATDEKLLYNIYVPVADFYNPTQSISLEIATVAPEIATLPSDFSTTEFYLLPVLELDSTVKLVAIDDQYYLSTFRTGAFFDYLELSGNSEDINQVTELLAPKMPIFPNQASVLSFVQTGVTALSRGMNTMLDRVGDASYFAANIGPYLSAFDITHTSNESSFSNYANSSNICAKPGMINALTSIGLDIVELTGNHNQDCGDDDALATLNQYRNLGIQTVGGGETATAASVPLQIAQKDSHITMLAYNLSTGGYTLDGTPGANFYTKEKALADIAAAKARGDFIIIDIQYYECNEYNETYEATYCDRADSSAGDQVGFFRELIDMGADIVVGTAAHQPQTYERYHNGVIYYGLGNLFFDQVWWPGTTRSLMLEHYFYQNKLLQTRIVGTIYGTEMQPRLMDDSTYQYLLGRLNAVRPSL